MAQRSYSLAATRVIPSPIGHEIVRRRSRQVFYIRIADWKGVADG